MMKRDAALHFLFVIWILSRGARCDVWSNGKTQIGDFDCILRADGLYPDVTSRCQTYYLCHSGLKVTFICREGRAFDERLGICVYGSFLCSGHSFDNSLCSGLIDGFYPDIKFPHKYFQCIRGQVIEYSCPHNNIYDSSAHACTPETKYNSSVVFSCRNLPDGYYQDFDFECRRFHLCINGRLQSYYCPAELIFSLERLTCDYKSNVKCFEQSVSNCSHLSNGVYPNYDSACKYFKVCKFLKVVSFGRCADGKVLNRTSGQCELADAVGNCIRQPTLSDHVCTNKTDGLYANYQDYCRSYHQCINQSKIDKECPAGKLFSPMKDRCDNYDLVECKIANSTLLKPSDRIAEGTCDGRKDGMYPDYDHGCRRYVVCEANRSTTTYCPVGQLFNTETMVCDHEDNVDCDELKQKSIRDPELAERMLIDFGQFSKFDVFECPKGVIGFFADYTSGCQKFYTCYKNIKKSYSCPDGLLFNPDSKNCDLRQNVNCIPPKQSKSYNCTENKLGYYSDVNNRTKYYKCIHGHPFVFRCPTGQLFNKKIMTCDVPRDSVCDSEHSHIEMPSKIPSDSNAMVRVDSSAIPTKRLHIHGVPGRFLFRCDGRADGFYPDYARGCHVFYRCLRGVKYSHYCKQGLLFSPVIEICDFEENVTCKVPVRKKVDVF